MRMLSVVVGLSVLLPMSASAAPTSKNTAQVQLRAHYENVARALRNRDSKAAMVGYAEDVLVFDIPPPLQVVGKQLNTAAYDHIFAQTIGPYLVDFADLRIRLLGPSAAFATSVFKTKFKMRSGDGVSFTARITDIFEKRNGHWLVVHEHVSLPVNMKTGTADMNATASGKYSPFERH